MSATFLGPGLSVFIPVNSRVGAFGTWQLGVAPDSPQTFTAALIAMGLCVGFGLSTFRFFALREMDVRRLDFIMIVMQVRLYSRRCLCTLSPKSRVARMHAQFTISLFWTLRACMMIPLSTSFLAGLVNMVSPCAMCACVLPMLPRPDQ